MATKQGLGFEITELRLGLPGASHPTPMEIIKTNDTKKRVFSEINQEEENNSTITDDHKRSKQRKPTQVVGWPPVCSYRKKNNNSNGQEKNKDDSLGQRLYVKVAMDGAPYLRKIDLNLHNEYSDLVAAFEKLFGCPAGCIGRDSDGCSEEYIPLYEDKDGDWMLVGDVPYKMFSEACKRLRIMKGSDAKRFGLRS